MTTNQTIDGVPRRAVEWAFERLEICQDQAFQSCECEECEQCGKMPDECSGTDCAKTCQCSTCDHCSNALAMTELRALLDVSLTDEGEKPAIQPQGEPVYQVCNGIDGWIDVDLLRYTACSLDPEEYEVRTLYAEHPAPVAAVLPERSNQDYAIEHAEYMALSADDVLAKFQAYGLALLAVDEGGDDGEGELLENIDSARGDLQESLVDLRSMVYEFRKRSAKS